MLGQTDHPFIIQLICTYADPTHIYFLMTPALGGEILNVLTMLGDEEGAVEEKVARFYITSIALALQYLHSLEVTQRNLHLGTSPLLRPRLRPRLRQHLRPHLCS